MDLIYTNASREDVGVLQDFTIDLAFGSEENDFECVIVRDNHCCYAGCYLYFTGTEYGGIIDDVAVDTAANTVTYSGRTYHGILNSKIIQPDQGEDYLIVSGEANEVIDLLLSRMGVSALFSASPVESGINISNYKMNRYIKGYDGIKKMLKAFGGKLKMNILSDGTVELSAVPFIDYSQDEQFDTDQIAFKVKTHSNPINHVICLGQGNLAERTVINLYADVEGNISYTQSIFGLDENAVVYDYSSTESVEELEKGGREIISNSYNQNTIDFSFDSDASSFDVGDYIGAKEFITGIFVRAEITKKVVKVENDTISINYEMGDK